MTFITSLAIGDQFAGSTLPIMNVYVGPKKAPWFILPVVSHKLVSIRPRKSQ